MSVADEMQKELIYLDKVKKNFARRINYKINKTKDLLEQEINGGVSEKAVEKFRKDKQSHVENEIKADEVVPTPVPDKFTLEEHTADEAIEVVEVPQTERNFEIAKSIDLEYDYFLENMWHPSYFDGIKPGDIFRIRFGNKVLTFYDKKNLKALSFQSTNKDDQRVMKVCVTEIPT